MSRRTWLLFLSACLLIILIGTVVSTGTSEPDKMPFDNGGMVDGQEETPPGLDVQTDMDVVHVLMRFGWMKPQRTAGMTMDSMASQTVDEYHESLMRYQQANGLPMTGKADTETMNMMRQPRCSNPDNDMSTSGRRKRFVLQGSKWDKKHLTYLITNYSPDLPPQETRSIMRQAFDIWEGAADLKFTEVTSGVADILIKFAEGKHGDNNPFDGPAGVLAHAYYPRYGGNAHFDDGETWTHRKNSGFNLLQVAVHEFGHSLGLSHSMTRGAIMFPSYQGYTANFVLHRDDIDGIRQLYGPPTAEGNPNPSPQPTQRSTQRTTTRKTTTAIVSRSPCDVTKWDAVVTTQDGNTYFFVGSYYYRAGDKTARFIANDWGISSRVNSAITLSNGYSLIFQGKQFHVFRNQRRFDNQYRETASYFPGIPQTFVAAWIFKRNRKLYVSQGRFYWRYNGKQRAYDSYYPHDFNTVWRGAPEAIDTATTDARGTLHFFKGQYYYTLDSSSVSVVESGKSIGNRWFQCANGKLEDDTYMGAGGGENTMKDIEMSDIEDFSNELMQELENGVTDGISRFGVSLVLAAGSLLLVYLL